MEQINKQDEVITDNVPLVVYLMTSFLEHISQSTRNILVILWIYKALYHKQQIPGIERVDVISQKNIFTGDTTIISCVIHSQGQTHKSVMSTCILVTI